MDLSLDIGSGDLALDGTGNVTLTTDETIRQRLVLRLRFFLGEWFLDLSAGVPFYQNILVKNADLALVRTLLRAELLKDEAVASVPRMILTMTGRDLLVELDIQLVDGSLLPLSESLSTTVNEGAVHLPLPEVAAPTDGILRAAGVDLALDLSTGDLDLDITGMVYLTADAIEAARQRLTIRLRFFLEEWFLDTTAGVPYYQNILVKAPDLTLIRNLFRRALLEDPSVVAVPRLVLELDGARLLSVEADVQLADGSLLILDAALTGLVALLHEGDPLLHEGVPLLIVL